MNNRKVVYLDNAAATRMYPEALEKMLPFFCENYANAFGSYQFAQESRKVQEEARKVIAKSLGALPEEIYFTSGGTESDNWAIRGAAESRGMKGHIITTKIEHHAVLRVCKYLEERGVDITYLDVDREGIVDVRMLKKAIRKDTFLISVMYANNEIGTIQPIREIGKIAKEYGIWFHTDAVQAYGHVPMNVEECGVDLLSVSGHKFHGPKGVGFLYIRNSVPIKNFMYGGDQESGKRAGTGNTPGIAGMAAAVKICHRDMEKRESRIAFLRDYLIRRIETEIPEAVLNGHRTKRLPGNVSFCFRKVQAESMLVLLDLNGICASGGSACSAGSLEPSHVILAIGREKELADGALRFTLSEETTEEELDYTIDKIKQIVARLK